ncbi:hypothetical protein [Pontimicrobium aquaticum]|uniref:Uncharacterized protein n=1 Tax=Pontimicrobium aquaticum TaxID=2565367 RepID=A0A4U0F1A8_9FLAO|nr:hypothetical protein [Pontimicrobium aquaticum]TJY38207.1 hypothetical protein E5167_02835 [Pontimicrobium aquaticum]
MSTINTLITALERKNLKINVNMERPYYIQPEDRLMYRAHRVLLILKMLNTKRGLSKEVIACVDFLLRNTSYQRQFILQYFKDNKKIAEKIKIYNLSCSLEMDSNIVQYKSLPWDLRFNDMFLFLLVRELIVFTSSEKNPRAIISEKGIDYSKSFEEIFPDEINFLEIFGKTISEEKTIHIITKVIPESYWKENEKLIH